MENYSEIVAAFVSETNSGDIPENVRERCRQSLMNGSAAALSATFAEPTEKLLGVLLGVGAAGEARLFGRPERLDLLNATLVNAYMSHLNDYDDTHLKTTYHTNPSNVPAVLGLGADRHIGGNEVITALALGFEASIRLGLGLGRIHYDVGWHSTGTLGTVGTALTCSRLLGLDAKHTNYALGLALTQAAGLRGLMFGSMAKGFNAAKASYNGLLAALLAEQSFTAAENAIEGGRGYASAASDREGPVYVDGERRDLSPELAIDLERITNGLGSRWETLDIGFKPYASGAATHATIDGVLKLRRELGLNPDSSEAEVSDAMRTMKRLKITIPSRSLSLPRGREIATPLEAKFSMYNVAAIVLARGKAGPAEYNEAALVDPTVSFLRDFVELAGDPDIDMGSGSLSAEFLDGHRIEIAIDHALGTKYLPLDNAALRTKLFDASAGVLSNDTTSLLADALADVENSTDVGEIMKLASG